MRSVLLSSSSSSRVSVPRSSRKTINIVCNANQNENASSIDSQVGKMRDAYGRWKDKRQHLEKDRLANVKDIYVTLNDIMTEEVQYMKGIFDKIVQKTGKDSCQCSFSKDTFKQEQNASTAPVEEVVNASNEIKKDETDNTFVEKL